jgi:lysophospholipase L1-like esterase
MEMKKSVTVGLLVLLIFSGVFMYAAAVSAVTSNDVRVACVGDSITALSGYPQKLQILLGGEYLVANFGVSGSTICQSSRLPYVNQPQFEKAGKFNPDIVLIMLGTNDANHELTYSDASLEEDYTNLVESFQSLPSSPQVFVVTSPPIFTPPDSAYNNANLINNVNPRVASFAERMNLPTIDLYTAFGDHAEYFEDGVHPTDEGASLIASTLYDSVTAYSTP